MPKMNRNMLGIGLALGCLAVGMVAAAQKTRLPAVYQKWLDEEVSYIIRPLERDVFLKLRTDRERNLFIEAFWKQRDPAPGTPENEFKTEHYRRINHANRTFSRSAPFPGWKTDRGRIYIILGEPHDIQRYNNLGNINPAEVWFYQDKANLGFPGGFHVVFFQEGGVGDFRLYSPSRDGPQALIAAYSGDRTDYQKAYQALLEIEPSLANVSLSLLPGESDPGTGRPSLASELLIQRIENSPQAQVRDQYAEKFLQYKDVVDVEYSANYMDSESLIKLVKDPAGIYFVHYAVEPKRISVDAYEKTYTLTLKLNGTVTTLDGKLIHQFEKPAALKMDEARLQMANAQPLNVQDMFPLIPGTYKLSILLKNEFSKEFTSFERTLVVPGESPALQMTSPILGFMAVRTEAAKKALKPFQVGPYQMYCQPGQHFTRQDTLSVAFQVAGLSPGQRKSAIVRYAFSKNGQPASERSRSLADYPEFPVIYEAFPLADFAPAYYELKVGILVDGRELVAGKELFDVYARPAISRPWYYAKLMPEASDPLYAQILGIQSMNAGRLAEAKTLLEGAYRLKPESPDTVLALAHVYGNLGETGRVPAMLAAFLEPPQAPNYEIFWLAGQAQQKLGAYAKALGVYDRAVTHFGVNTGLLNAIGECLVRLDRLKEALAAWEKSLAIDANQPEIRKKAESLRDKK